MTLGDKIRAHRKALGMTQTELGAKLGVKVNAVSKWECGRVEDIPTSKIKALASIFNVPTSYLIDDDINAEQRGEDEVTRKLLDFVDTATADELRQLLDFIAYLLSRRSSER